MLGRDDLNVWVNGRIEMAKAPIVTTKVKIRFTTYLCGPHNPFLEGECLES